jgi:hypothetical protein
VGSWARAESSALERKGNHNCNEPPRCPSHAGSDAARDLVTPAFARLAAAHCSIGSLTEIQASALSRQRTLKPKVPPRGPFARGAVGGVLGQSRKPLQLAHCRTGQLSDQSRATASVLASASVVFSPAALPLRHHLARSFTFRPRAVLHSPLQVSLCAWRSTSDTHVTWREGGAPCHREAAPRSSTSATSVARLPGLARRSPHLDAAPLATPPCPLATLRHPKTKKHGKGAPFLVLRPIAAFAGECAASCYRARQSAPLFSHFTLFREGESGAATQSA